MKNIVLLKSLFASSLSRFSGKAAALKWARSVSPARPINPAITSASARTLQIAVLLTAGYFAHAAQVLAQAAAPPIPLPPDSPRPSATILFHDGASDKIKSGKGRFGLVGLQTHETADIQLQFPLALANTAVTAQALDGGKLSLKSQGAVIAADGSLALRFKVKEEAGLYRILVTAGGVRSTLQFWVQDAQHPKRNPPALIGRK